MSPTEIVVLYFVRNKQGEVFSMKAEELYTEIQTWYNDEENEFLKYQMQKVLEKLDEEITMTCAKKVGKGDALKVVQRIVKSNCRDDLKGIFRNDGMWCVCDNGISLIRFKEKLPVREITFEGNFRHPLSPNFCYGIALPTVADVRKFITMRKATIPKGVSKKNCAPYTFAYRLTDGTHTLFVDANRLLDVMLCLPNCSAHASSVWRNGVRFFSDSGDALLMPIKVSDEYVKEYDEECVQQ